LNFSFVKLRQFVEWANKIWEKKYKCVKKSPIILKKEHFIGLYWLLKGLSNEFENIRNVSIRKYDQKRLPLHTQTNPKPIQFNEQNF